MNADSAQVVDEVARQTKGQDWVALEARVAALEAARVPTGMTLIVFSPEVDKLMAALTLATGAAAMGTPVTMFFTFWGVTAIKRAAIYKGKRPLDRLMTLLVPPAGTRPRTSRFNLLGFGSRFLDFTVRRHSMQCVRELMAVARQQDIRFVACQASMEVLGVTREELMADVSCAGVATCLDAALDSRITLFV